MEKRKKAGLTSKGRAWAFETLWERTHQTAAMVDEKGEILFSTRSWARLFPSATRDTSIWEVFPALDMGWSGHRKLFCPLLDRTMETESCPMDEEADAPTLVFIHDHQWVSAQVHDAVKSQKKIYETILDSIEEGVTLIDDTGCCIYCNKAAGKIEGVKKEERLGRHLKEIYPAYWQSSLQAKVIRTQKPILNFHQNYPVGNRTLDVISNNYPFYFENRMSGAVSIFQNFSKYQKLIEQNMDLQDRLKQTTENRDNETEPGKNYRFTDIVGQSRAMVSVINRAKRVSDSDSPVLIYGETGTGKELFARSIHNAGPNADGPFLAINCAAIPENLLEGLLFGTTRGAFTGAEDKAGLFEQANNGSLFLDEINSMSMTLQSKLLRVLQEKCSRRLGQKDETPINARIISSMNADPQQALDTRQIRSDLFYRLAVIYLVLPPLRERSRDILRLSDYFVKYFNRKFNKNVLSLDYEVIKAFLEHPWPGNVRQLRHAIESAMNMVPDTAAFIEARHIPEYMGLFLTSGTAIVPEPVPSPLPPPAEPDPVLEAAASDNILESLQAREKEMIVSVLKRHQGKITQSAKALGISRQCLQYRLKKYGLKQLPAYLNLNARITL